MTSGGDNRGYLTAICAATTGLAQRVNPFLVKRIAVQTAEGFLNFLLVYTLVAVEDRWTIAFKYSDISSIYTLLET